MLCVGQVLHTCVSDSFYATGDTERGCVCRSARACPSLREPSLCPRRLLPCVLRVRIPGACPPHKRECTLTTCKGLRKLFVLASNADTKSRHWAGVKCRCDESVWLSFWTPPAWDVWALPRAAPTASVWPVAAAAADCVALVRCVAPGPFKRSVALARSKGVATAPHSPHGDHARTVWFNSSSSIPLSGSTGDLKCPCGPPPLLHRLLR